MSQTVVLAFIAIVFILFILFGIACVHYLTDILSEVDNEGGHGGANH
ncbi:MAG: hypothetical protein U5K28_04320 [Halobacteriales archaeon]|nr:hypothetical protein [Halobacteriales archaeon]